MSLLVRQITAKVVDHPVRSKGAIISFLGRHEASHYVTLTVTGDDGQHGYAEAATAPVWSGEAAETAVWMLENYIAPQIVGARFDHPSEAVAILDRSLHGNSFIKSAVDIALWDLWARSQGVSVASLVADREPVRRIPTRVSIGCYPPEETVQLAVEFWEAGVRTLKFKTGKPGIDDVARLRAVRDRLGSEPVFTIDSNGAHATADEAVRSIEALAPFNLSLVEQPTPRDRIGLLAEVRKRVSVPILADEAVFTPDHLEEALRPRRLRRPLDLSRQERWVHPLARDGEASPGGGKGVRDRFESRDRPRPGGDGLPRLQPVGLPGRALRLRPDGRLVLRRVVGHSADRIPRRASGSPDRSRIRSGASWPNCPE